MEQVMDDQEMRRCGRFGTVLQVLYDDTGRGVFRRATLCNNSEKGMYIETDRPLAQTGTVYVKMLNPAPGAKGPERFDGYYARVCWEQELGREEPVYGAGLEYGCKVRLR